MKLVAALLALAFASGTDDEVLQRLHVRVVGGELAGASCRSVIARNAEAGFATIHFEYRLTGAHHAGSGPYMGKLTFALNDVVITMPSSIVWSRMTDTDRTHAEGLRRAILHHEIGHVRVAEAVRDELNAGAPVVAPDPFALRAAADARGRDGFDRFKREEREYDALTEHGGKQHAAAGELAGPDTIIRCS
jgi:hypothetical protein